MKRYVTRNFIECEDYLEYYRDSGHMSMTVDSGESDTFSGLYDADGNELHHPRQRVGFLR